MQVKNLIYISKYPESVFWSQVFELLKEFKQTGFNVRLLAGMDPSAMKDQAFLKLEEACTQFDIGLTTFEYHPIYPFLVGRTIKSLRKKLKEEIGELDNHMIHVRDEFNAYLLFKAGYYLPENTLVDVRASNVEEVELYSSQIRWLKVLKLNIKRKAVQGLRRFRHINVVSSTLEKYLVNNYGLSKTSVCFYHIPCLAGRAFAFSSDLRKKYRLQLGVEDQQPVVVFSSGGVSGWQRTDLILDQLTRFDVKVLNLSKTPYDHPNVITKFVPYDEVPGYLMAADVAILWREDNIVNQVASPVKFSEYVCAGLPTIVSNSVKIASDFVSNNKAGYVMDDWKNLNLDIIKDLMDFDRDQIAANARQKFGIAYGVDAYLKAFSTMRN